MSTFHVSYFIKVTDEKNQNEVKQNSSFRYHGSERLAEIWPNINKLR